MEGGDQKIREAALKKIDDILRLKEFPEGYSEEKCRLLLEENGTMQVIKELRRNENSQISELAHRILDPNAVAVAPGNINGMLQFPFSF